MSFNLIFIVYFVVINLIGFILMGVDKKRARNDKWRVQEKTLWTIAWIGGALGNWLGMSYFRHKTKHTMFTIGTPIIMVLHIVLYVVIKARLLS
ncbi:DUF1294 domain-containing protein [Pontibacillus sp. HMF3514]|uniref:DUF1294 domain-containing protein n=1 Tax=Pontibacillus sp. HMF3514 TaxID=2692425 RepID=UPI00131FAEF7|nr:DUF1294 domain-containing protein [Pontibacillus sp. HMF3514]QHE53204.1 DUF1294 domain-containing protein [Pontibacillus sp. HMF3514]